MATDWRAVGVGTLWGLAHLGVLSVPPFERLGWASVPLVLATGLLAGAATGRVVNHVEGGGRHGLLSGGLVGACFAVAFWVTISTPGLESGVFHALSYLLATNAQYAPVIATHGEWVVGALAVCGGFGITLLGEYAGRRAPQRGEEFLLVEE
jgi:hypothetical protein